MLIRKVEIFLRRHSMPPTTFSRAVGSDPTLVSRLRNGVIPHKKTEERVLRFMENYGKEFKMSIQCFASGNKLRFTYTNWKDSTRTRTCIVETFGFGMTDYHGGIPQWFLNGFDTDKQARRSYSLQGIDILSIEVL